MHTHTLRSPLSTIARSSSLRAAGLALGATWLILSGCAPPAQGARSRTKSAEAPAPHLRQPVDHEAHARRPDHHDPLSDPALSSDVSLEGILAFADQHSPVLSVARATRSRADAARAAASLRLPSNPELTVAAGPRLGASGTGVDVEVGVMQQIQISGERGLRLDAADRLRELTDAEIEQMRWTVHCDVHAAFHRALVEQQRAELAQRVVAFQQEVLRVVQQQITAGETAPLTLRLAQAEVAQAQQVLVGAQQAFYASRIRLAQMAGWPAAAPPFPTGSLDTPRDPPLLSQLSEVAKERLPRLRALQARLAEARARLAVADRQTFPRPSLGVQYTHEGNPGGEGPDNIVMGVLSTPITSVQRNQGERSRTNAEVTIAGAELAAAEQLLEGQIVEARSEVVAAAARTRAYGSEILPRFEENLTLLRRSFELGEIDILALSSGRERFLRIQNDALSAQQDYFVALASLERVVGVDLFHDDHHKEHQP